MAGTITISLYNVSDDNEKINKTLGTPVTFENCSIKDQTDVTRPVVRLQTSSNLSHYNYLYIDRYSRYYYIDRIETTPTGMWILHCRCDVLKTYASQILDLDGTITRSENLWNMYLNDPEYKAYAYRKIVTKKFPNAIDGDCFILMTVG